MPCAGHCQKPRHREILRGGACTRNQVEAAVVSTVDIPVCETEQNVGQVQRLKRARGRDEEKYGIYRIWY
jgi:hypothetical protein